MTQLYQSEAMIGATLLSFSSPPPFLCSPPPHTHTATWNGVYVPPQAQSKPQKGAASIVVEDLRSECKPLGPFRRKALAR